MEFIKREKKVVIKEKVDIEQRLLSWPDCYYTERNPNIRKELLDAADARGLTPEDNGFRRMLYDLRYGKERTVTGEPVDNFIRAWMELRFLTDSGEGLFARSARKRMEKTMADLGFGKAGNQAEENLLAQELCHLGMHYAALCQEDKNYNSLIFGFGTISDDRQARKIAGEFRRVANTPERFGLGEKYALFGRSLITAYCRMFPDYEGLFDD